MKMHSPGHSSEASTTASSRSLGHGGHAGRSARLVLDRVVFLHVGETVVQKGEHGRRDLLAQPIACAEILVDPDLHVVVSLLGGDHPPGPLGPYRGSHSFVNMTRRTPPCYSSPRACPVMGPATSALTSHCPTLARREPVVPPCGRQRGETHGRGPPYLRKRRPGSVGCSRSLGGMGQAGAAEPRLEAFDAADGAERGPGRRRRPPGAGGLGDRARHRRDDGEPELRPLPRLAAPRRRQAGRPDVPRPTGQGHGHLPPDPIQRLRLHRPRPLLFGRPPAATTTGR